MAYGILMLGKLRHTRLTPTSSLLTKYNLPRFISQETGSPVPDTTPYYQSVISYEWYPAAP